MLERSTLVLVRQARKHARLPEDAEEALQAACILFIERYKPGADPLPWLQTTVKREAWRIAKRAHRRHELSITAVPRADGRGTVDLTDGFLDLDSDPADAAEASELCRERSTALATVKPDQRTALLLRGLGCSYAEIAALRGWTHTKVNRCISEGRAALRALLART